VRVVSTQLFHLAGKFNLDSFLNMKKIILWCSVLINCTSLIAQTTTKTKNKTGISVVLDTVVAPPVSEIISSTSIPNMSSILPPSPESAALGKYGSTPVSYYTGTPSISIPIHEVADRKLGVSINLSYHASGIKIDEVASSVGMGWVLNAGGVITRSVHGLPDEESFGYRSTEMKTMWSNYKAKLMTAIQREDFERGSSEGRYDMEPDEYSFNFLGRSGMMLIDQNNQFFFTQQTSMKVKLVADNVGGYNFVITDENGTSYYFTEQENSTPSTLCNNNNSHTKYVSAWYLTKIVGIDGNQMTFTYTRQSLTYIQGVFESFKHTYNVVCVKGIPASSRQICKSRYLSVVPYISKIDFTNGSVDFVYENRTDLVAGGLRLNSINIKDKSGVIVIAKRFKYINNMLNDRYFLSSVEDNTDLTATVKPTYYFGYNAIDLLPARNSTMQDYWGYYNNNTTGYLMPAITIPDKPSTYYTWANRNSDSEKIKYGVLTQISYPTGGKSVFEYQVHDYGYTDTQPNTPTKNLQGGGIRIKSITDYSSTTQVASKKSFAYRMPSELDRSSGLLLSKFVFSFSLCSASGCSETTNSGLAYCQIIGNSNSNGSGSATQGSPVGYEYVTETIENNGVNIGRTEYNFTSYRDYVDGTTSTGYPLQPPFVPFTNKDGYRGKEKRIVYYNNLGVKLKEDLFTYSFYEGTPLRGFKAMITTNSTLSGSSIIATSDYEYISLWSYLKEKREKLYNSN
jgi:hypothetical protein